jgi:hypothetical protein
MKSAGDSPGDTEESTVGVAPNPYPNPPDRHEGTVQAPWGEEEGDNGGSGTAQHHSNAAWEGFKRGREEFLKRHFDSFGSSADATNKTLEQNFDHFKSRDHESSKPFTNDHSNRKPEVVSTLLQKTHNLLGRY